MASKAAATTAAKAIYAAPHFVPKGPITSGRFNLVREVLIGTTIGVSLGMVWKTWHWSQKRKIADYYRQLDSKEQEDERQYQEMLKAKILALEEQLAA